MIYQDDDEDEDEVEDEDEYEESKGSESQDYVECHKCDTRYLLEDIGLKVKLYHTLNANNYSSLSLKKNGSVLTA